ncbi:YceI family protein [Chryseolinea sp. T2]|uniref:YceI family protein n=1 Tax=Chryseolinea sp. T2 TaxID=3129255 RepID=UPI00307746E5
MENTIFRIAPAQSRIEWVGKKVTGTHDGTIQLKGGEIVISPDGKLVGGRVIVDTTSIKVLDITDPTTNTQMTGHLASDDFFSSEQFPEAYLTITSVENHHVNADLTIKGITHPIAFDVSLNTGSSSLTVSARLLVDRTKYDMKFRSGNFFQNLGDTLIYNDFELNVSLTAKAISETVLS